MHKKVLNTTTKSTMLRLNGNAKNMVKSVAGKALLTKKQMDQLHSYSTNKTRQAPQQTKLTKEELTKMYEMEEQGNDYDLHSWMNDYDPTVVQPIKMEQIILPPKTSYVYLIVKNLTCTRSMPQNSCSMGG